MRIAGSKEFSAGPGELGGLVRIPLSVIIALDAAIHAISYPPMRRRWFYVYILASRKRGTLYIGVTNDLARRLFEHRDSDASTFVGRYRVFRLVYVEEFPNAVEAIRREKALEEMAAPVEDRPDRARQPDVVRSGALATFLLA